SGIALQLRYPASRVVNVSKDDRVRWARLLAGGLQFTVLNLCVSAFRVDAMLINALHAVSALLHHAPAAYGDVGIAHHLELRRLPILEEQEVEAANLVRAVVRAIARAHAAVIDHVIQAFAAVDGRPHRADNLARGVLTLHARYRLEIGLGVVTIA